MTQLIKDAAISKLAAPIGAADTSLTVNISEADLFPPANTGTDPVNTVGKDWFKLVLEDINHNREVIYVRTRTLGSATMSNLLRGQEGTTAISFASGSTSGYLSVTSQDMQATIDLAAQATAQGKLVLNAATPEAQAQALGAGLQKQSATAFTTAGTATAYTLTPTPAVTAYVANLSFDVTFHLASGDNPTFQISGLVTPPNLVKQTANGSYSNISASDITANHRSRVKLLSATQALVENLPVVDAKQLQTQAATAFTSTGTAPAYTLTPDPAIAALVANQRFRVKFHSATTGAATLAVNGLAATAIKQYDSTGAKVDPTIVASQLADVEYDGTHWVILDPLPGASSAAGLFHKVSPTAVAFDKTGAATLNVKAGTVIDVLGVTLNLVAATAVVMPTLSAGTDYAIYACQDGTVRADASFTAPTGYTTANSRLIGGFHYGLVAPGTTLAGGSFNTLGSVQTGGMVWVQGDVDNIAGINKFSLWDLKWRANVSDLRAQKGFVLTDAGTWVAIYFASTNCDTNGLSKYNTDVASGTVLPKIPATMGGNGTLTYADYNWWRASEHARAYGARLLTDAEANIAFFGVTENQSLGGAASTIPLTTRQAGYTSKYGVEQATGHHWIWGDDSAGTPSAYVANGGRGQSYASGVYKVILGGVRVNAANSGSRTSSWGSAPTGSYWDVGLRAACDHLMLA